MLTTHQYVEARAAAASLLSDLAFSETAVHEIAPQAARILRDTVAWRANARERAAAHLAFKL